MTIAIFTEPEVTICFSKIALVIIRENKTKLLLTAQFATPRHQQIWLPFSKLKAVIAIITARERFNQRAPFSIITSAILLNKDVDKIKDNNGAREKE